MADVSYFLLAATFVPLVLSPVAYILARRSGVNVATWFSFGALALSSALLFIPAALVYSGLHAYSESYIWGYFGNFGLRVDGLSLPFAVTIYILCTVIALYSKPYMVRRIMQERQQGPDTSGTQGTGKGGTGFPLPPTNVQSNSQAIILENQQYLNSQTGLYFALYLTFSMGMVGTVLATNLIEFYVFFELMLVPSFFLVAFYGYGARRRISLMFFFWTHVGAVVLLLGLLAMGFFAGGFDFDTVRANVSKIPTQWMMLIVFALVVGFGVKLAAFLLHVWLPYVYSESPTSISALLAAAMTGIGAYGLLRLWLDLLVGNYAQFSLYIEVWGLVTMVYGGAMALLQDDVKKLLAYSSISSMGYILFGLGSASVLGVSGATLLYVTHALGKAILFMMAGSVMLQTGTRNLSRLGGLAGKMPYTAVFAMIGLLTLIGIPPTSGFMAEWVLFTGVLQNAVAEMNSFKVVLFAFGILTTVLSSAYLLWMYKKIFFGKVPEDLVNVRDSNRYITASMGVFAALTLIIGVYPDPFLNPILGYIKGMFASTSHVVPTPAQAAVQGTGSKQGSTLTSNGMIFAFNEKGPQAGG